MPPEVAGGVRGSAVVTAAGAATCPLELARRLTRVGPMRRPLAGASRRGVLAVAGRRRWPSWRSRRTTTTRPGAAGRRPRPSTDDRTVARDTRRAGRRRSVLPGARQRRLRRRALRPRPHLAGRRRACSTASPRSRPRPPRTSAAFNLDLAGLEVRVGRPSTASAGHDHPGRTASWSSRRPRPSPEGDDVHHGRHLRRQPGPVERGHRPVRRRLADRRPRGLRRVGASRCRRPSSRSTTTPPTRPPTPSASPLPRTRWSAPTACSSPRTTPGTAPRRGPTRSATRWPATSCRSPSATSSWSTAARSTAWRSATRSTAPRRRGPRRPSSGTGEMIQLLDDVCGPYPFEAYGVLAVDEPLGFALETQTLTLIGSDIAHRGPRGRRHPAARAGPPVGGRRREPGDLEGHLAERGLRHLRRVALGRAHGRRIARPTLARAVRGVRGARPPARRPRRGRAVRRHRLRAGAG